MKIDKKDMKLYVVTDRSWLNGSSLVDQVEETVKAGATFVQLREKHMDFETFVESARGIKKITDLYKIPFVINDDVEVAIAVNADGVHIGQNDESIHSVRAKLGVDKIIGLSAHNVEEAIRAEKDGADYIGVGAVFCTSTKQDANNVSFEMVRAICKAVSIPVVAIGGISKSNVLELSGTGIDGVAVVSAIFSEKNITKATKELWVLVEQMINEAKEV